MTRLHDLFDRLPDWFDDAACPETDPDAFFPEKGGSVKFARRVCAGCGVHEECLAYALDNEIQFGVWGGTTERQRKTMLRQRKAAAAGDVGGQPC